VTNQAGFIAGWVGENPDTKNSLKQHEIVTICNDNTPEELLLLLG
jgi:hypothetical protein